MAKTKNHVNLVKSSEEIGVKYMQEWGEKILDNLYSLTLIFILHINQVVLY